MVIPVPLLLCTICCAGSIVSHSLGSCVLNQDTKTTEYDFGVQTSRTKAMQFLRPAFCVLLITLPCTPGFASVICYFFSSFSPSDKRLPIKQSYFLDSSRCSVLHSVLSAESLRAAGLCANWGFTSTAEPSAAVTQSSSVRAETQHCHFGVRKTSSR